MLIIAQRNYGDAIMLSAMLERNIADNISVHVLSKKEFRSIFEANDKIAKTYYVNFPIASYKGVNLLKEIAVLLEIRGEKYDVVLDYVGDFRERILGWLCDGRDFVSVFRGKVFSNLVRGGMEFLPNKICRLNNDCVNVYEQIKFILESVGLKICYKNTDIIEQRGIVGIHLSASQECKLWKNNKWHSVVDKLESTGKKIYIFGAPNERKVLEEQFGDLVDERVEIFTGTLDEFMVKLKELDVLIGLDSFSVHAAYATGVPNIMICGANDYRMWQTPLTKVVAPKKGCCPYWPCYNKPKCSGRFSCIESISVDDVLNTLQKRGGTSIRVIGVHPFASQTCRSWPWDKWREVVVRTRNFDGQ